MAFGSARCNVLEILNEVFVSGLGFSIFESVLSTKEATEFSILPAFSGLTGSVSEVRASH